MGFDPKDEYVESYSKLFDPDYVDSFGSDIFDRLGETHLGGRGFVTGVYHYLLRPLLKGTRKVYMKYQLGGYIKFIFFTLSLLLAHEMFINRKIHQRCICCRKPGRHAEARRRGQENMKDVAR